MVVDSGSSLSCSCWKFAGGEDGAAASLVGKISCRVQRRCWTTVRAAKWARLVSARVSSRAARSSEKLGELLQ